MTAKNRFMGCALLLLASCIMLSVFWLLKPVADPDLQPVDLLVGLEALPEGWIQDGSPYVLPESVAHKEGFDARALVQFSAPGATFDANAGHLVGDLGDSFAAMVTFYTHPYLGPFDDAIPKRELQSWNYRSRVADRFRWFCSYSGGSPPYRICQAEAQYGRFISEFGAPIDDEYMTMEDFGRVLTAIDERMASALGDD